MTGRDMEFIEQIWQLLPGSDTAGKVGFISAILGIIAFIGFLDWLWQKFRRNKPEKRAAEDSDRLKRIEKQSEETLKIVLASLEAREAALPGGGTLEARQAEAGIEKDIGAAIATLAEAGKTAALEALGRGDTAEADAALAAKIAEIGKARGRAAKEEAALYRQRGALAYLNAPLTALPLYAKAAELDPDHPAGWNELGKLQMRTGALDAAIKSFETVLRLGNQLEDRSLEAIASGNLGVIHSSRGDLDAAEASYRKALEIDESLGNKEGMARLDGNLGEVYRRRSDLDAAEAFYRKALEIDEALGIQEGTARWNSNFGIISMARGDLDAAEAYYRKALEIAETLGNKEQRAGINGNLGSVCGMRDDRDAAEAFFLKAIALYEQLGGISEGLGNTTGNLGIVYAQRGDMAQACAHWRRARDIWRQIGNAGEVAKYEGRMREAGFAE